MIRRAGNQDFGMLTGVLMRAFAEDPLAKWLAKDETGHRILFEETVRFGLSAGEVLTTSESQGAAIWFAPGKYTLGAGGLMRLIPKVAKAFGPWQMLPKVIAVNEVGKRHPKEPHWYLFSFGVDPPWQGKGVGGALMRHQLEKISGPAYLETALEKNVALYERFGFSVVEKVQVPRGGPPVWLMWRDIGEPSGARRGASEAAVPPRMPG
jgi:ribosomal protein S18 acetylase RimI-like enzyme